MTDVRQPGPTILNKIVSAAWLMVWKTEDAVDRCFPST